VLRCCWCVRWSLDPRSERSGWLSRGGSQSGSAVHTHAIRHSICGYLGVCDAGSQVPGCWHCDAGPSPWRTGPFPAPHHRRPTVVAQDDLDHSLAWHEQQQSRLWPLYGPVLRLSWAAPAGRPSTHPGRTCTSQWLFSCQHQHVASQQLYTVRSVERVMCLIAALLIIKCSQPQYRCRRISLMLSISVINVKNFTAHRCLLTFCRVSYTCTIIKN